MARPRVGAARRGLAIAALLSVAGLGDRAHAAQESRTLPIDCLPDAVQTWNAAPPNPDSRFGAKNLPGIVLGPPGASAPTAGSTTVASLGPGGSVVLAFGDTTIEDRPGPDFIVFENAFFVGGAPLTDAEDYTVFDEPGSVEVSADGVTWKLFAYDASAVAEAVGHNVNKALQRRLRGVAGITPTFTGNWTVPDDLDVWDPSGTGGVSGAGGDAFDLATVGLATARFVRLTDLRALNGPTGNAEGFDLDAVVVLHGKPLPPADLDTDGDGLSDRAEVELYHTAPSRADTDGDGTDDGREVAGCRDPNSTSTDPWLVREPRVWVKKSGACTDLRWTFLGSGLMYDVIRGDLAAIARVGSTIDLGVTTCVANDTAAVAFACDAGAPVAGKALFFLVRLSTDVPYGRSSRFEPEQAGVGCP